MDNLVHHLTYLETIPFAAGGFAVLLKASLAESSHAAVGPKLVAVKLPNDTAITHGHADDRENAECVRPGRLSRWQREITAGQRVVHPNILKFLGLCDHPDSRYEGIVGIVLPYCANGDAGTYIKAHPEVDLLKIICGVSAGLLALHTASPPVVHGDIKASNILISDDGCAFLSDFGLSRVYDTKGFTTYTASGTSRWMAVELLRDEGSTPFRVTTASDIWAFAMTILEILTNEMPFAEMKREPVFLCEIIINKYRPMRPRNPLITDAIWTLLEHCWREEPELRPDVQHVGLVLDIIRGRDGDLCPGIVSRILKGDFEPMGFLGQGFSAFESNTLPYKCKWSWCSRAFLTMEECTKHECREFERRHASINLC